MNTFSDFSFLHVFSMFLVIDPCDPTMIGITVIFIFFNFSSGKVQICL